MATLHKFKILATQCGVTQSPTRSPRTSPLVQLPRKKTTLRMLLTRNTTRRSPAPLPVPPARRDSRLGREIDGDSNEKKRDTSHKLKDLFVSSTTSFEEEDKVVDDKVGDGTGTEVVLMTSRKLTGLGGEPGSGRPAGWVGMRHRLLRKAWRPMLVAIPE